MNCKNVKIFIVIIILSLMIFTASCAESSRVAESPNRSFPVETGQPKNTNSPIGEATPQKIIDAATVTSISVEARYKNYFDPDSKCRKSYDEMFGKTDGFYSEGSPCTGRLSVSSDGAAIKTIELSRYDKNTRQMRSIEKSTWTAKISDDDFRAFAEAVVSDDFIKNYPEGMQIYTSNFSVSVSHSQENRTKTSMGNADDKNPRPISIIELFKKLDGATEWTKVE